MTNENEIIGTLVRLELSGTLKGTWETRSRKCEFEIASSKSDCKQVCIGKGILFEIAGGIVLYVSVFQKKKNKKRLAQICNACLISFLDCEGKNDTLNFKQKGPFLLVVFSLNYTFKHITKLCLHHSATRVNQITAKAQGNNVPFCAAILYSKLTNYTWN